MSDEDTPDTGQTEQVLGPQPSGGIEAPDRFPGGPDSVADEEKYGDIPTGPLAREVPAQANPATSDAPESVQAGDDKTQEPEEENRQDMDAGAGDKDADADDAAGDDEGDESVDTAEEPGA